MPDKPNMPQELILLLVLSTLWGASYTFIKVGVESIPPVTLIAARTLLAGAILTAIIRWRGLSLPRGSATWRRFLFQAGLNSVVPFTLIAWAEQSTDAGLATILNSTSPVFAFLLTALVTRHEVVTGRKLFGVGAGLLGTCLIVGVQALGGLGHELWAQLAIVAATICYAAAAIFGKNFRGLDPMMPAAGSLLCGAANSHPGQPRGRSPVDAHSIHGVGTGPPCALGLFDSPRLRNLFSPRADARIGWHHGASLPARADRSCNQHPLPGRKPVFDRVARLGLCHCRRRRDDLSGAPAGSRGLKRKRRCGLQQRYIEAPSPWTTGMAASTSEAIIRALTPMRTCALSTANQ